MLSATKQAISIKIATTVGHFVRDLDFANVYIWLDHLVSASFELKTFKSVRRDNSSCEMTCCKRVAISIWIQHISYLSRQSRWSRQAFTVAYKLFVLLESSPGLWVRANVSNEELKMCGCETVWRGVAKWDRSLSNWPRSDGPVIVQCHFGNRKSAMENASCMDLAGKNALSSV